MFMLQYSFPSLKVQRTFLFFFSFSNFIVIQVQFSAFSPHSSLIHNPPQLPSISAPPPDPCYCPCVLYNCSYKLFTLLPWNSLPLLIATQSYNCCSLYCKWGKGERGHSVPPLPLLPNSVSSESHSFFPLFYAEQFRVTIFCNLCMPWRLTHWANQFIKVLLSD